MYKKTSQVPITCKSEVAWFCIWLCEAADGSHRPVLQQRAVVHGPPSVQKSPEHRSSRAAVSPAGLRACRHNQVLLQRTVGLKAPVEKSTKPTRCLNHMLYG